MRNLKIFKKFNSFKTSQTFAGDLFIEGRITTNKVKLVDNCVFFEKAKKMFFSERQNSYLYSALIAQKINLSFIIYFKKLKLHGIGFKSYKINNKLILLKVGFTHKIYYHIKYNDVYFNCKKSNIMIYGNDINKVNNIVYTLKNIKKPNAYKGKGIQFTDEKLKLKIIKKKL